jgi:hypothetical protein
MQKLGDGETLSCYTLPLLDVNQATVVTHRQVHD